MKYISIYIYYNISDIYIYIYIHIYMAHMYIYIYIQNIYYLYLPAQDIEVLNQQPIRAIGWFTQIGCAVAGELKTSWRRL